MAERLRPLLRRTLRIFTTDNRIFLGSFAGTDQPLNIVLVNAEEFRLVPMKDVLAQMHILDRGTSLLPIDEADEEGRDLTEQLVLENQDGRYVGQVLIPWRLITKIEADVSQVSLDVALEEDEYT